MNRRSNTIQKSLPMLVKMIGRQTGVEVKIGGQQAYRQGNLVVIPDLPLEDPQLDTLVFGFAEHEAAHVRYTEDIDAEKFESVLHHGLWNAIEDVRIEHNLSQEFPGFGRDLDKLLTLMVERNRLEVPAADKPAELLSSLIQYRLRHDYLNQQAAAPLAEKAEELCSQVFPASMMVRVGSLIGRVPTLQSAHDTLSLASEMMDVLKDEAKPPEPPPAPESNGGDDADEADGSENETSSSSSGAEGDVPSTESERSADGSDGETSSSPSRAEGDAQSTESERLAIQAALDSEEGAGPDLGAAAAKMLEKEVEEAVERSGGLAGGVGNASPPPVNVLGDSNAVMTDVNEATMALKAKMRLLMESQRRSRQEHRRQGVRVNPRRLIPYVVQGDRRVFSHRIESAAVNTSVTLLLDRSDSMSEEGRMQVARRATLALADSMMGFRDLSVDAAAFPGLNGDVDLLLDVGERASQVANRFSAVHASGGTPLYEALMWAVNRQLSRSEARRLIIVVTDGMPYNIPGCQAAIERCWSGGIEVYGVGIKVPNIAALFGDSRSCAVMELTQLPTAMFRMLQHVMTRQQVA